MLPQTNLTMKMSSKDLPITSMRFVHWQPVIIQITPFLWGGGVEGSHLIKSDKEWLVTTLSLKRCQYSLPRQKIVSSWRTLHLSLYIYHSTDSTFIVSTYLPGHPEFGDFSSRKPFRHLSYTGTLCVEIKLADLQCSSQRER